MQSTKLADEPLWISKYYQIYSNDDSVLTIFMTWSNLLDESLYII